MNDLVYALNAERDAAVDPAGNPYVKQINRELKQVDRHLEVVWVGERVPVGMLPGVVPGRWHVRRTPPGQIDSYWPILAEDGGFRDLDMGLIENMKKADLWRDGALEELRQRRYKRMAAKAKAAALEREQAKDLLGMDLRAAGRVFGDGGMKKRKQFKK